MLAGFLVASSAAAMVGVYFLMSDYFMFVNQANDAFDSYDTRMLESELSNWLEPIDSAAVPELLIPELSVPERS